MCYSRTCTKKGGYVHVTFAHTLILIYLYMPNRFDYYEKTLNMIVNDLLTYPP